MVLYQQLLEDLNMKKMTILAMLAACLLSSHAFSRSFTVGVQDTDYRPIFRGDQPQYSGYARELLDTFAAKHGYTFSYRPFPSVNLYQEFVVNKSLDFKFPDNPNWSQDIKKGVNIVYSKGILVVTQGLMVSPENKGKGVENISKMVTLRGFTPFPFMEQIKSKKIDVMEVNYAGAAINIVASGRVDGAYMGVMAANYVMSETLNKKGLLVFDDTLPHANADFSLSSIAHPDVIQQFNEFLVKEKDALTKLKAKYKIVE